MEYVKGNIHTSTLLLELPAKDRRLCYRSMIETLAKLHSINYKEFIDKTPKESYYERQLYTLTNISKMQGKARDPVTGEAVGDIPHLDQLIFWMKSNLPTDEVTLIHGDYKVLVTSFMLLFVFKVLTRLLFTVDSSIMS